MARTYQLTDGTTTVDLIDAGSTGIIAQRGGFGGYSVKDLLRQGRVAETYQLVLKGSSHDNAASQAQTFIKLLLDAQLHESDPWQTKPVYLQVQATNETNARYARVYTAVELEFPDLFNQPFEGESDIEPMTLTIVRAHPWESSPPGSIGSAITLGASDGPANPTKVHIANHRETSPITIAYSVDNSSATFTEISTSTTLFPSPVAQNDYLVFGTTWTHPMSHIVLPKLSTAGSLTTSTLVLKYYNGSAWTALTLGTDYTVYPGPTLKDCFEQTTEDIVINLAIPSDITKTTLNSINANWIKIEETNASPAYATNPVTNASDTYYAQKHPYVEIPAASIKGDSPPLMMLRFRAPAGGDESPGFANLSRLLIGAKSRGLDKFVAHLNAGGNQNPAAWTTTQKTDATATTDPEAPGGKHCAVDFSTNSTMVARVELKGTSILDSWAGEYRAMVRCQQIGGSAGDLQIKLRTFIGGTNVYDPQKDSEAVDLAGADEGPEVVDLGLLEIPFSRAFDADSLASTDLIFQIFAKRTTGSSTLRIYDLILIPVDEGSCGPDHLADGDDNGSGALRGNCLLDVDPGIIDWRAQKYVLVGGNPIPAENWAMQGKPIPFKNLGTKTRLYFLMLHYPTTWGTGPLVGSFGMHLSCEVYAHYRYTVLRGSD